MGANVDAWVRRVLKSWPKQIVLFSAGVVSGLLISLPLLPWELPEQVSSLLGSVLGAAIGAGLAVIGSVHLIRAARRESDEQIHYALDCIISSINTRLDDLFATAEPGGDGDLAGELLKVNDFMQSQVVVMDRIQLHLAQLGPLHMQITIDAELAIKRIAGVVKDLAQGGEIYYYANPESEAEIRRQLSRLDHTLEWSLSFEPGER